MSTLDRPGERFVSEPIEPDRGSFDTALMVTGLASPPAAFRWRGRRYRVVEILEHYKLSTAEGGVIGGERYLRRQVFRVRLDGDEEATIYVLRQPPRGASPSAGKKRWFLYSISS